MIDGIAQDVDERLAKRLEHGPVGLDLAPRHHDAHLLSDFLRHVARYARERFGNLRERTLTQSPRGRSEPSGDAGDGARILVRAAQQRCQVAIEHVLGGADVTLGASARTQSGDLTHTISKRSRDPQDFPCGSSDGLHLVERNADMGDGGPGRVEGRLERRGWVSRDDRDRCRGSRRARRRRHGQRAASAGAGEVRRRTERCRGHLAARAELVARFPQHVGGAEK